MPQLMVSLVSLGREAQNLNAERIGTGMLLNPGTASTLTQTAKRKRGRPRKDKDKETNTMTPTTNEKKYSPITKTVFDLKTFADVKLEKPFVPPTEPKTLQEALELVGNDQTKLLKLITTGLEKEARDIQSEDMSGFKVQTDEGEGEVYTGQYADESQGKLINAGILTMAKLYAGGTWESKNAEEKKALKIKAGDFIRSNPAMLQSFAPSVPTPAAQSVQ